MEQGHKDIIGGDNQSQSVVAQRSTAVVGRNFELTLTTIRL